MTNPATGEHLTKVEDLNKRMKSALKNTSENKADSYAKDVMENSLRLLGPVLKPSVLDLIETCIALAYCNGATDSLTELQARFTKAEVQS